LVEDDLQLQSEVANDLEDDFFIRLPGRDDAAADRERGDIASPQLVNKKGRRLVAKGDLLPIDRLEQNRPVLDYRQIENVEIWENPLQVQQLAPGDQDQLATGMFQV